MKLLVVCLGNICRSPMAEGALQARLAASPLAGRVQVDSAGTGGWHAGEPPDRRAIACAQGHGVDIAGQRARQLHAADFEAFDWILCADRDNLARVRAYLPPAARARAMLLREWAECGGAAEIPDPYSGGSREFEHAWSLLDEATMRIAERLRAERG